MLLPTPGNVLFTLLVVAGLLWASSVGALPLRAPAAATTSTGTIAYQGRLADADGNPLTGTYNMIFRLYDVPTGGVPLWEEQWTGSNGVRVSDGLFNVMLGSLEPIQVEDIAGHDQLWLGITVGTDNEMEPRVQLGSVPFAVQALTLPDGASTQGDFTVNGNLTTGNLLAVEGASRIIPNGSDPNGGVEKGTDFRAVAGGSNPFDSRSVVVSLGYNSGLGKERMGKGADGVCASYPRSIRWIPYSIRLILNLLLYRWVTTTDWERSGFSGSGGLEQSVGFSIRCCIVGLQQRIGKGADFRAVAGGSRPFDSRSVLWGHFPRRALVRSYLASKKEG